MTIESGIIFGNFETLSSSPGPYGSSDEAKEYPVQNYEKKRIVRPGEDVVAVIVRFPSRRLASGDVCRIRDRRHVVGCVRWAACAPGARSFPHESGLRALSVLLVAACCILGALRDGSHEPAVDCKARHGRFREKERLFVSARNDARTPDDSCPAVRRMQRTVSFMEFRFGGYGPIFPNRLAKDGPGMRKTDARASPCFRSSSFRSGYSPAMKSRMARSCASMLCKSRN